MGGPKARRIAEIASRMADDPTFGYSQKPPSGRWGPDFDCASFVYFVVHEAGYPVGIGSDEVRFTGTMLKDLKDAGFQILPFANVGLGELEVGDILLNLALHAEVYVGDGQVVGAQGSETGGYVGKAGDQTGQEIMKQPAYIYEKGWDYVLRPPEGEEEEDVETAEDEGDEEMPYPYGNNTMGTGGSWAPQNAGPGYGRTTWMPPAYGGSTYPQGNLGQMNGYSQASGGNYAQPGQMYGAQQANQSGYPQGGSPRHLTHVKDLNEVRDIHVNPGECVPVFLEDGKYMVLKSADQEGFPNMRVFEMTECSENMPQHGFMGMEPQQQPQMQQQQGVSREEFEQLKEMISSVQSAISGSGFAQGNPGNANAAASDGSGPQGNANGRSGQSSSRGNSRNS